MNPNDPSFSDLPANAFDALDLELDAIGLESLSIPELVLLEQSGELPPALRSKLTAWRKTNPEQATMLESGIEQLTRPLPDPGVPLPPLRRDHILKAGRAAHLERVREESAASKAPAGKILTPAWEREDQTDQSSSSWSWLGAVAALAAVFLFGLYVTNRPGPEPGIAGTDPEPPQVAPAPEQAVGPEDDMQIVQALDPVLVNDTIEAFLNEPYAEFTSQLGELDHALFQSQVDLADDTAWLAQLD